MSPHKTAVAISAITVHFLGGASAHAQVFGTTVDPIVNQGGNAAKDAAKKGADAAGKGADAAKKAADKGAQDAKDAAKKAADAGKDAAKKAAEAGKSAGKTGQDAASSKSPPSSGGSDMTAGMMEYNKQMKKEAREDRKIQRQVQEAAKKKN